MKIKFLAKSLVLLLLLCVAATLFSACGSSDDSTQPPSIETPDQSTGENGDTSGKPTVDPTCEHEIVTDPAVEPTCTEKGKTEGSHCSVCNEVLTAQEEVPEKGHTWQNATCEAPKTCSTCNKTDGKAMGHNYVDKYCTVCNTLEYSKGLSYKLVNGEYTVTGIGTCKDLDVVIPKTYNGKPVTGIGEYAFKNLLITSVVIQDNIKRIEQYAFPCPLLSAVHIFDLSAWCNIEFGYWPFDHELNLYMDGKPITDLIIPEDVTKINSWAFYYCKKLESVVIPNNVTTIGSYVFEGCQKLTTVKMGNNVTAVGGSLFQNCTSLKEINLSNKLTSIPVTMFRGCTELTSISIPDSVQRIGHEAFSDCPKLNSITIGKGVTSMDDSAFYNTKINSVYITNLVTWCNLAYSNPPSNPALLYDNLYLNGQLITEVEIPAGIDRLSAYQMLNVESIIIGNDVKLIEQFAFYRTYNVKRIEIRNGVQKIMRDSFSCENVTEIIIADSVTTIGEHAFWLNGERIPTIWCEASSKPDDWDDHWYHCSDRYGTDRTPVIHWGDEWEYVDGVPTLKYV